MDIQTDQQDFDIFTLKQQTEQEIDSPEEISQDRINLFNKWKHTCKIEEEKELDEEKNEQESNNPEI